MPEQHMVFSTHLDDDIIFMNNDIYDAIESGEPVTSVYLVTGSPERELGIKAAYSVMAGANDWVDETVVVNGKEIASSYLASNPDVRTYFLRFPDQGSGNSTSEQLYDGQVSSITTDDGVSYTKAELTQTLTGLMDLHQPDNIMKHGAEIAANGGDHGEHIHFSDFVTDALAGYTTSHDVDDYLGYSVAGLEANVTGEDYARKEAVFEAYGQYDTNALTIPVFRDWLARQYQVGPDGQPVSEDWDIRGEPPVVPPSEEADAVADRWAVEEDSWAVIGNVLDNDAGAGLRVVNGYNGFVGNAYLAVAENGDVRLSQRGEFDDLAPGETREVTIDYTIEDADGNRDAASFTLEIASDAPPPPPAPTGPDAITDSFVVEENSWDVIGNVLDNDDGEGLRVINGYNWFVGDAYLAVASNGDVRLSQRGEFDDLAPGETRTVEIAYTIEDMFGEQDSASFELILEGEAEDDDAMEIF